MNDDKQIQKTPGQQWLESVLTDERSGAVEKICDGTGVSVAQLQGSLMEAALSNPDIMRAKPASVFKSVLQAARLGVVPSGMRNGAYYSIYAGECKLGLGYGALTELAVRFGNVKRYTLAAVHPNDGFSVTMGTKPSIDHTPNYTDPGGKAYAYYAIAWFDDGSCEFEVMRNDQIDHVMSKARARGGPWHTDRDEMAKKTVLIRLHKRIPMPAAVGEAVAVASEADGFEFGGGRRAVSNEADDLVSRVLPGRKADADSDTPEPTQAAETSPEPAEGGSRESVDIQPEDIVF